jgi:hypothetical protein
MLDSSPKLNVLTHSFEAFEQQDRRTYKTIARQNQTAVPG